MFVCVLVSRKQGENVRPVDSLTATDRQVGITRDFPTAVARKTLLAEIVEQPPPFLVRPRVLISLDVLYLVARHRGRLSAAAATTAATVRHRLQTGPLYSSGQRLINQNLNDLRSCCRCYGNG